MRVSVWQIGASVLPTAVAAGCAELVVSAPAGSPLRAIAGLALALIFPGVPASRLVPFDRETPIVSVILVFGLSIALVILDSAALYVLGVRLDRASWAWSLAAVTGVSAVAALFADRGGDKTVLQAGQVRAWRPRGNWTTGLALVVAVGAVALAVAMTSVSIRDRARSDRFTQLWALPRTPDKVQIGVYNHEGEKELYRVDVRNGRRVVRVLVMSLQPNRYWTAELRGLPMRGEVLVSLESSGPVAVHRWVRVNP